MAVLTLCDTLAVTQSVLEEAGIKSARLDAIVLMEFVRGISRAQLLAEPNHKLTKAQATKLNKLVKKRVQSVPLAYITGAKEFYGLRFKVTPDVLIPRPETESLVDLAVKLAPKSASLIDVGTGSGCIAVAVAKYRPDLQITATDISAGALTVAKANAHRHKANIKFVRADLFKSLQGANLQERFDVVVANLPYLSDQQAQTPGLKFEPRQALRGGPDGLKIYHRLFAQAADYLIGQGFLIIEALPSQHKVLAKKASDSHLTRTDTRGYAMAFQNQKSKI